MEEILHHQGCIKPHTNWCRISSINRMNCETSRKKKRSEWSWSWRCFIQKKTWKKTSRYPPKRNKLLFPVGNDGQVPLKDILFWYGPTVLKALIPFRLIPWAVKLGSQRFTNSLQRKWWPSSKVVIWRVLLLLGGRRNLSWPVWDS